MSISANNLTLTLPSVATSAETDMRSRLRVGALVNLLIQSAIASADKLGFGFSNLRERQLFWVLRSLTVEISRPVAWNEAVEVETWPKDVDGIQYLRDFIVRAASGEEVARATSAWLAIDYTSKRPKRVVGREAEYFIELRDKHGLEEKPGKLDFSVDGEPRTITPTFFDIDLNGHVTTTRYVDWMVDCLNNELLVSSYPKRLAVVFLRETLLGESIELHYNTEEPNTFRFEGRNVSQNVVSFRGEICF